MNPLWVLQLTLSDSQLAAVQDFILEDRFRIIQDLYLFLPIVEMFTTSPKISNTPAKRYIRHMTNNNEYDLNQTLVMVWGRFYHPSCSQRRSETLQGITIQIEVNTSAIL